MFDSIVIVKIIEMQNDAERRRWRRDEDAFYSDLDCAFGYRFIRVWRRIRIGRLGRICSPTRRSMPAVSAREATLFATTICPREVEPVADADVADCEYRR